MQRADCSNKALARLVRRLADDRQLPVRCDHVSVKRWLDGVHPRADTAQLIAEALARKLGQPVTVLEIGMGYAELAPDPITSVFTGADLATQVSRLLAGDLSGNPAVSGAAVTPGSWDASIVEWLLPSRATLTQPSGTPPRSVRIGDIEALEATTQLFSSLDYRFGGGHARAALIQYLQTDIQPILSLITPDHALGRRFLSAVAAMMRLAAWMAYDSDRHGLAQTYMAQALHLAQISGDRALGGRILAGMSHQANYLGHFTTAENLALAAQSNTDASATPTARALSFAMEARALASQGRERRCAEALLKAEKAFAHRNPEADPDWLHYFDEAELAGEFAHCFNDLRKPKLAREHVLHSLSTSETLYVRSLGFVRTILARSYVVDGDLDQALTVANEVVGTATDLRSARLRRYLADFTSSLAPWHSDPRVIDFRNQAESELSAALNA
jgi:hypothetical protein